MRSFPPALASRWFWLVVPPLAVVAMLYTGRSVWAVFAVYHVGICLLSPLAVNLGRRRLGLSGHAASLDLAGPATGRGMMLGLVLMVVLGLATALALRGFGPSFLAGNRVADVLAAWGAGPDRMGALLGFMGLVNGPAEEHYWRGFVATEFPETGHRLLVMPWASAAYASYHGFTIHALLGSWSTAVLFTFCIWLTGMGWSWLRRRSDSLWPPLLAHLGATLGYMAVARSLVGS